MAGGPTVYIKASVRWKSSTRGRSSAFIMRFAFSVSVFSLLSGLVAAYPNPGMWIDFELLNYLSQG